MPCYLYAHENHKLYKVPPLENLLKNYSVLEYFLIIIFTLGLLGNLCQFFQKKKSLHWTELEISVILKRFIVKENKKENISFNIRN
jgi:hypothetical protein